MLTIHWNLQNPCEDIVLQQSMNPRRMAIAERPLRRIKEGTSAVLLQSGLEEQWWDGSMECYCYLRNVQDLLSDGKTPWLHQFGKKVFPGIFFGYALIAW